MDFNEWAAKREWWKENTRWEFQEMWNRLSGAGYTPLDIGRMLDRLGDAVADEFGSNW